MVTDKRMKELKNDVRYWKCELEALREERQRLLLDQSVGRTDIDASGIDRLPEKIDKVDGAVLSHQRGLLIAEDRLGRARNGEDV